MKGQITDVQPLSMRTIYTPLHGSFSVVIDGGGSLTQFYYTNANQYIPNRATTPMKLCAKLYISDPDKIIPSGDKSSTLTLTWYENTENTPISSSTPGYTVNADGTLTVAKNVPVDSPIQIVCRASYTDTRTGLPIIYQATVNLNTIQKSDEKVSLYLNRPTKFTYNPLTDSNMIDIKASLKLGEKDVAVGNAVFWWYKVVNGVEQLIDSSELNIEYVSGQGTATLRLDADNIGKTIIRCRGAYYTGAKPSNPDDDKVFAETAIVWKMPHVTAQAFSPNGTAIRKDMITMSYHVRIFYNGKEVAKGNIAKYFFVKWFKKSSAAGSSAIEVGHGTAVTLPVSELKTTGGQQMMIYPVVYAHGPYEMLTDKNGDPLRDKNNEILIGY